jgi:benzoyl-CoA reductase subunit C
VPTPIITSRSLDEILEWSVRTVESADYTAARLWRENGGKVVGHFQVYFPEELAHAAGVLPIKMRGASIEASTAEARFGSYLCSILKTTLELGLSKQLELDMFVSHPICDAARNLASVFERNFDYPSEILYLPQNANSGHARDYLAAEYQRLLHTLEEIGGRKVSVDDLRNSVVLYNENRALMRRLYELKREKPWLLATDEAYALVSLAGMLPKEEHNELLMSVLESIEAREVKAKDRVRVVFEGGFCEQPPLDLLRTIDRSCYIVDDDLMIGLRWILEDVSLDGDPLQNLAHAYLEQSSYSPVQHDLRKPKEKMLIERTKAARADAVILTAAKMCEPGLEDQVAYAQALEENGIPFFISEFQENMTSFEHMELQLETFVENLLFD